jgi:hypothetical protein
MPVIITINDSPIYEWTKKSIPKNEQIKRLQSKKRFPRQKGYDKKMNSLYATFQ